MEIYKIHTKEFDKRKKISAIYTFVLVISPILFAYGVGFGTVTLFDATLIILNTIFLMEILRTGKLRIYYNLLPFFVYIFIITLFLSRDLDALMRTLRYMFYIFNIILFVETYFDINLGIRCYRAFSLISTAFLFLQIISFNLFNIYIPGVIIKAKLIDNDLYGYELILRQARHKRFMSFFAEPSHYAIYLLGYITILLFTKMNKKNPQRKDFIELIFLSVGIVVSTSILGITVLMTISLIWFCLSQFKERKNLLKILIILPVFFLLLFFLSKTTAYEYFSNAAIVNKQATGRFGGYSIMKEYGEISNLFGRGMIKNNYGSYLASYPLLVFYFGYFGLFVFLTSFIPYFFNIKKKCVLSKFLIITFLGISLGSEIILGMFILIFMPFIIKSKNIIVNCN